MTPCRSVVIASMLVAAVLVAAPLTSGCADVASRTAGSNPFSVSESRPAPSTPATPRPATPGPGSRSSGPDPLRPASAPAEAALAALVARLSPPELTRAALGPVPADLAKDSSPSHPTDRWVYLTSTAQTAEAQTRAHWQASLVVADLWRLRGGVAATNPIRGGALTQPDSPGGGSNDAAFGIPRLQQRLMFIDSAGKPSRLVMSRAVIVAGVRAAAAAAHLRVTDFRYTTLVGTVLEVRAVTDDPFALLRSGGGALPDVDTSQLEGVLETIVDSSGRLVRSYTQTTGFKGGSIGYGNKYSAFAATLPNRGDAGEIGPDQPLTAPAPAPRTN